MTLKVLMPTFLIVALLHSRSPPLLAATSLSYLWAGALRRHVGEGLPILEASAFL